jgi:hypothetical protein
MRLLFALVSLSIGLPALAGISTDFEARADHAKLIEQKPETQTYLYKHMFPAVGSLMAAAMKNCLAVPGATADKFTLVADISQAGSLSNIAYQPQSATAACFARAVRSFRVPAPRTCKCESLPIVIDMNVTP